MAETSTMRVVGLSLEDASDLAAYLRRELPAEFAETLSVTVKTTGLSPRGLASPIPPEVILLAKQAGVFVASGIAAGALNKVGEGLLAWVNQKLREWVKQKGSKGRVLVDGQSREGTPLDQLPVD